MDDAQVNFQQLRIKHILYKSKFRSAIYGGAFDSTFFSSAGPVSVWFNTVGLPNYGEEPELKKLMQLQRKMDAMVEEHIGLYRKGKIEEAHEGIPKLNTFSEAYVNQISTLEHKLHSLENPPVW